MRTSCEGPRAINLIQDVGPKLEEDTDHDDDDCFYYFESRLLP